MQCGSSSCATTTWYPILINRSTLRQSRTKYHHPVMQFFGWGRKKDPPPIQPALQELIEKSDAARGTPISPGTAEYGSDQLDGQEDQPQITPSLRVALPRPSKDCFGEAGVDIGSETWEERLQETIRFLFSHEQQGLLAIGTFALDQLAAMAHLDGRHIKPPATDHNSRRNSVSSVQVMIREVRSSDDELIELHHSMRSPIPAYSKRQESYFLFGDHDESSSDRLRHVRALSVESTMSEKFSWPSAADHLRESQAQGPPCIANVEELGGAGAGIPKPSQASEVRERQRSLGHSFGKGRACAHTGKWIRTDSEFVVLEM